ncbi:glycosyltransferase family 4 protein [Kineococcus rubinsiae]|uniref:glycosyltransferase family 4 protein n=1 Tax=Kineococcus rubinsiae TaxID=2609562 RepID=UPI001430129A|nr:glycosyltransferase family 4 protein [Kineococcus rubinsiae]NIZ92773.1 glycosyltransferase family 4 protein [Kineococcus rubinsiae]
MVLHSPRAPAGPARAPAGPAPGTAVPRRRTTTGLLLASRGDALTPYLFEELERRFPVAGRIACDLTAWQRAAVALTTFRPSRVRWAEQFFKSGLGYRLRTVRAARERFRVGDPHAPVFQVHALFEVPDAATYLYVDCTHRQSAEHWPAWNPLRGRALRRWYAREERAYRAAAHVFAFSRATRRSLVEDYGVDPFAVTVVGAGINGGLLPSSTARRRAGWCADGPSLLFIGNDFARKGGPDLLRAFAELRREFPGARLRLVGTRPDVPPQPGVEVLGRVHDRDRIAELYADADVFVLPTVFDPLPLVLLEAMAHGVPVVTTASCGIPDVLRDGREGTVVPARDPGALAAALARLLRSPDAALAMADAAARRATTEFSWSAVVDRMAAVLHAPPPA